MEKEQHKQMMLRHIEHLEQQLVAERERADFAWQNTRIIEKARQEEMRLRDEERHRADVLAATIRDLSNVVTHDMETKADFITRICSILAADPDERVQP